MAKQQQPKAKADSVKKSVKVTIPQVKLYPSGSASRKSVDSLKKTDPKVAKAIGKPSMRAGATPQYGTQSSDVIKKLLNKPTAKPQILAKKKK